MSAELVVITDCEEFNQLIVLAVQVPMEVHAIRVFSDIALEPLERPTDIVLV